MLTLNKPPRLFRRGGVYQIKNLKDGKVYVGSSIDIFRRLYIHRYLLQKGTHFNIHLQRAWNRDGEESFVFTVLQLVTNRNRLLALEALWFKETGCLTIGYNQCREPGTRAGVPQTRYQRRTLSRIHKGKPKSAEHKAKISAALKGRVKSLEWRARLAEATRRNMRERPELREAAVRGGHAAQAKQKNVKRRRQSLCL